MKRLLVPVLVVCVLGPCVWLLFRYTSDLKHSLTPEGVFLTTNSGRGTRSRTTTPAGTQGGNVSSESPLSAAPAEPTITNAASTQYAAVAPLPQELANLPEATVLENMRTVIRQYGTMFGGNPVGTNEEITRALQGDNPRHINFLKADGNRVNASGQLVDIWGTPYFFHQLSGTQMEIRSAGPDRRMWTSDDLVTE